MTASTAALLAVLALAAPPSAQPPSQAAADDPPPTRAELQQVYDDSCASREFGAYDDVCDQLRKQIRQAETQEARAARGKPPRGKAASDGAGAASTPQGR